MTADVTLYEFFFRHRHFPLGRGLAQMEARVRSRTGPGRPVISFPAPLTLPKRIGAVYGEYWNGYGPNAGPPGGSSAAESERLARSVRADLEAAMAAVITSRAASADLLEDAGAFATEFSLTPADTAMLIEMAGDLALLTSSFVRKRCSTVRWNARRTLELLGREGDLLVEEFVEEWPMSGDFRSEAAKFGDFVIERTAARDPSSAAQVIAAMAIFERHRSDSFWEATMRFDFDSESGASPHPRFVAGANVGRFEWDVRLPYRHRVDPLDRLPRDPCQLLFFHSAREPVLRAVRLHPNEGEVVEKALSAGTAGTAAPATSCPDSEKVFARLSWEGAVEWA